MSRGKVAQRVLIVFDGIYLYGMERGIIGIFDLLRPEVIPNFMISLTTKRLQLHSLAELRRRNISYTFLSDYKDWVRVGKVKSPTHLWQMLRGVVRGNIDILKASSGKDVLYIPGIAHLYFAFLAALLFRLLGKRVIYHFHNLLDSPSLQLKVVAPLITDFVHNSEIGYRSTLNANTYIQKKRNFIIPPPIGFRNHIAEDKSVRPDFLMKRNILFVGQVSKHKGVDILIKAFKIISNDYDDAALHIVGGVSDTEFKKELESEIRQANGKIKFWGYRDDVLNLLKMTYLYVHPTPPTICNESFGIATVEAMTAGVPTVCFLSGALPELVINEETGLVCETESPECLAHAMHRFFDDEEFRDNCGKRARERYKNNYSQERVKALWLELINGNDAVTNY